MSLLPFLLWAIATIASHQPATADRPTAVDFARDVQPILQKRCEPCHFPGGKMYAKLPFDRAETVRLLGEKLFTRIHDEGERRLIRDYLKQEPEGSGT